MIPVDLRNFKPEWIALGLNICILASYLMKREEVGKILYWSGAVLLTMGLIKMRG